MVKCNQKTRCISILRGKRNEKQAVHLFFLQAFQIFIQPFGVWLCSGLDYSGRLHFIASQVWRWRNWNSNDCDVSNLLVPSNFDSCYYVLFAWKQVSFQVRLWGCSDMLGLIRASPEVPIDDVSVIGDGEPCPFEFEQAYSKELFFHDKLPNFIFISVQWFILVLS